MTRKTITLEVTEEQEAVLRQTLARLQELEELADVAPAGAVLDVCEGAVLEWGRESQRDVLQRLVQRRLSAAEKKGRRSGTARAAAPRRTAASDDASS